MYADREELTLAEAVALFGLDEKKIRKDIEYGVFEVDAGAPRLRLPEVVYLLAMVELSNTGLGGGFGVEHRKHMYSIIREGLAKQAPPNVLTLGKYIELKLADMVRAVAERSARFTAWKERLVVRDDILGGEPVFPNSRIAVRQVGEMARRGASVAEILEDYPSLSADDIELAKQYAAAYPRVGRPRVREVPAG